MEELDESIHEEAMVFASWTVQIVKITENWERTI
jgi:hypothetical protein